MTRDELSLQRDEGKFLPLPSIDEKKSVHHVSWFDIVNKEKEKEKRKEKKIHFEFSYHGMIFDVLITVRVFRDKERERERGTGSKLCRKIWQIYEDKLGGN